MADTGSTSVGSTTNSSSNSSGASASVGSAGAPGSTEPTTGELINRLTEQTSTLIRSEMQLAKTEMTEKAKHAGVGAGLFGGAGIIALYGLGALIATIILVLATFLDAWLAALIVTVVLFVIAGIAALIGKKQVSQATPAAPKKTIDSVKRDVETVKGGGSS